VGINARLVGGELAVVVCGAVGLRYTSTMASEPHVTLSGDIVGEYVVEDRRADGRLVLVPDVEDDYPKVKWADMKDPTARDATPEEFAAFKAEYGPFLPPDGEG
jgi:hypothetical protein